MSSDFAPGTWVLHPDQPDWGRGQVQSVDGHRVTVNFTHAGKRTINIRVIPLATCGSAGSPNPNDLDDI